MCAIIAVHYLFYFTDRSGSIIYYYIDRMEVHLNSKASWWCRFSLACLCKQIEGLVREDSRIERYQKKVKGEMKVVWEWQGNDHFSKRFLKQVFHFLNFRLTCWE